MTIDEKMEFMLSFISDEYDTSPGSFFYDVLYSVASEAHQLQEKADSMDYNAFAITAIGEYLDHKCREQNIFRNRATCSGGTVRIEGEKGAVIEAGSKVASENLVFTVSEDAVIPESGYVEVRAECVTPGSIGNVKAGEINLFPVTLPGLTAVSNITDFTGGYDEESDEKLRERYFEKVSRPVGGGNKYQYIAWAKDVDGVGDADCIPLWNGPGTVKVIISAADGTVAGDDLILKVEEEIESKRLIGAAVTVESAQTLDISVSISLVCANKDKAIADVSEAVKKCLAGDAVKVYSGEDGETKYISYAAIGNAIYSLDSVEDYSDLLINGSDDNIEILSGFIPVLKGVEVI